MWRLQFILSYNNIGVIFPKGFYLHFSNFYISKDGIVYYCNKLIETPHIKYFLMIRLIALLDALLYCVFFPFNMLFYTLYFIFSFIIFFILLFTLPFKFNLCRRSVDIEYTNRSAWILLVYSSMFSLLALLVAISHLIFIPFQLLIPELMFMVFKQHTWMCDPVDIK